MSDFLLIRVRTALEGVAGRENYSGVSRCTFEREVTRTCSRLHFFPLLPQLIIVPSAYRHPDIGC